MNSTADNVWKSSRVVVLTRRELNSFSTMRFLLSLCVYNNYKSLSKNHDVYIFIRKSLKKWSIEEIVSFVFDPLEILFIQNNRDCYSVIVYNNYKPLSKNHDTYIFLYVNCWRNSFLHFCSFRNFIYIEIYFLLELKVLLRIRFTDAN